MNNVTLVTLNIWGGYLREKLLSYFKTNSHIDIFCLQEVYHSASEKISTCDMKLSLNIFNDIDTILTEHNGYFCPVVGDYGLAIFIKKSFNVKNSENILIHENNRYHGKGPTHQRKMQCITYAHGTQSMTICNVHGLWNGNGKTDSIDRIKQSENIKHFLLNLQSPYIVCGDFNLEPSTKSLMLIKDGLEDHIEMNNIISTRTHYYKKEIKYADYIFTSKQVAVSYFKVMSDVVSDHSPLLLKFENEYL